METLVKRTTQALLLLFAVSGCGNSKSVTTIIKLKSDTYISSYESDNKSELNYLAISNTAAQTKQDRILLRLPTNDLKDNFFNDCFTGGNLCNVFFLPVDIVVQIISSCGDTSLTPTNLTSAVLILNTDDGSSITAGALNINLLSKPWWHSVSWKSAHPFSSKGKWNSPGGDIDSSTSFDTNCNNLSAGSCASGEVKFEVTDFFKTLLGGNSTHYGLIVSANTALTKSTLYSVQANSAQSPRIVATYTCSNSFVPETKTFYLGKLPRSSR